MWWRGAAVGAAGRIGGGQGGLAGRGAREGAGSAETSRHTVCLMIHVYIHTYAMPGGFSHACMAMPGGFSRACMHVWLCLACMHEWLCVYLLQVLVGHTPLQHHACMHAYLPTQVREGCTPLQHHADMHTYPHRYWRGTRHCSIMHTCIFIHTGAGEAECCCDHQASRGHT